MLRSKHCLIGDTLIEVAIAIGIFALVAISVVAVVNISMSGAQSALEVTLAREEIDSQAETLRFIQSAYANDSNLDSSGAEDNSELLLYKRIWEKIKSYADANDGSNIEREFRPASCDDLYNKDDENGFGQNYLQEQNAFIIDIRGLNSSTNADDVVLSAKSDEEIFAPATTYPRLAYKKLINSANDEYEEEGVLIGGDEFDVLDKAEGIFIIGVKDNNTTSVVTEDGVVLASMYYDFYIRSCWYNAGAETPSVISTKIRLRDPSVRVYVESEKPGLDDTYQIIFNGNGGARNDGVTQTTQIANQGVNVTLTANPFTRSDYVFQGWATSENGPVVYADGQSVIDIGTSITPAELYAVWEYEPEKCPGTDILVMQNWNGANSLSMMESTSLCDIRDNQIYTVAKLDDGNVWMTQNLRLDLAAVTINSSNTNNPAAKFIDAVDKRQFGQWQCSSSKVYICAREHDKPIFSISSNSDYGAYYNYYTATAGTQPYSYDYNGRKGDICPAGWRLPTRGEWNSFIEKVYIEKTWSFGIDHNATLKKLLAAPYNYVLAGYYFNFPPGEVPLVSVGSVGFYWTSSNTYVLGDSYGTSANSYELWYSAGLVQVTTEGNGFDSRDVYEGLTLRCIRDLSL